MNEQIQFLQYSPLLNYLGKCIVIPRYFALARQGSNQCKNRQIKSVNLGLSAMMAAGSLGTHL